MTWETVVAHAVADPDITAWFLKQHERKVLSAHRGLDVVVYMIVPDDLPHDVHAKCRFLGVIDGRRIVAREGKLNLTAERSTSQLSDLFHAALNQVERFEGKGSDGASHDGLRGNDIVGATGVNLRDAQDSSVKRVAIACHNGLKRLGKLHDSHDRINPQVRHATMGAFALDQDMERIAGGHDRAFSDAK